MSEERKSELENRLQGVKPCPFCGSDRIIKGQRYFAKCIDCGATGPEQSKDATRFVKDWNSRTN